MQTNDAERLALLLRELIDTMTVGGTFEEMTFCDEDSGLPFVYGKMKAALALAVSLSEAAGHRPAPSHRLQ